MANDGGMASPARNIEELLSGIVSLPSLPGTVARALGMLNDPDCNLGEVGQLLSTDPALALKILRLANSAYYALRQQVSSVEHAVTLLGQRAIRNLVVSATVFNQFENNTRAFMRFSVGTGMCMEILTRVSTRVQVPPDEAFVYGVLHNIGTLILLDALPEESEKARVIASERGIALFEAEREIIGIDHAALGAELCRHWKLPGQIADAIGGHRDLSACRDERAVPLAALLGIATYIGYLSGLGDDQRQRFTPQAAHWDASGLPTARLPNIMNEYYESLPGVDELVAACA